MQNCWGACCWGCYLQKGGELFLISQDGFEDESDTKLLPCLWKLQLIHWAFPCSSLTQFYISEKQHNILQPVVVDKGKSVTWAAQRKSHPDLGDKNSFFLSIQDLFFSLQQLYLLPFPITQLRNAVFSLWKQFLPTPWGGEPLAV